MGTAASNLDQRMLSWIDVEKTIIQNRSSEFQLNGIFGRLFCCDHEPCPTFRSCTLTDVTSRLRTWRYQLRPCYPLQGQTTVTSTLGLDTLFSVTPLALGILTSRQARSAAALTGVYSEQKFRKNRSSEWNIRSIVLL